MRRQKEAIGKTNVLRVVLPSAWDLLPEDPGVEEIVTFDSDGLSRGVNFVRSDKEDLKLSSVFKMSRSLASNEDDSTNSKSWAEA